MNSQAFRDFRDLKIWNLQDSVSLRRAYVVYCISLVFIYSVFAFFGRVIVQLFNQWNVSGLQINVGTVDFELLALADPPRPRNRRLRAADQSAGPGGELAPPILARGGRHPDPHPRQGGPDQDADRRRAVREGRPADLRLGAGGARTELNGGFVLEKHLQAVVEWSYKEHVEWSDPEIRRKLNEYERNVRDEAEAGLDEFLFLTDPSKVPDTISTDGKGQLQQYEKRLAASVATLESVRDKFSIIIAIYCEHGSRFNGMRNDELRKSIVEKLADVREPPATGLPLYAFIPVFIAYALAVQAQWHPLISSIPLTDQAILTTAALETLKVFLLVWLPVTVVATFASVMGPDRGDRSVKESRLWAMIPGAIAAFAVGAVGMTLFALLYAALPASNLAQMQQSLLGSGNWTGALPYYLLWAPTASICFCFVASRRIADRAPGFWVTLVLALAAGALTLGYLVEILGLTSFGQCMRNPGPHPVGPWRVLAGFVPGTPWSLGGEDLETCFAYYGTLDLIVIPAAVFISVLGLARRRLFATAPSRAIIKASATTAVLALAVGAALVGSTARVQAAEVVLGFRTDIQPFSYLSPNDTAGGQEPAGAQRPYLGYIADLCYEIFDNSSYQVIQVPVTAANRFAMIRRPGDPPDSGESAKWTSSAMPRRSDPTIRSERLAVFSPVVFVTGVSYLWRSVRSFKDVELGYVENSTARRVAREACTVDALRLGLGNKTPACREAGEGDCLSSRSTVATSPPPAPEPTEPLSRRTERVPSYVLCPKARSHRPDKVVLRRYRARQGLLRRSGHHPGQARRLADPRPGLRQRPRSAPVVHLRALRAPRLAGGPRARPLRPAARLRALLHRSGAEALFYKWFPGQTMSRTAGVALRPQRGDGPGRAARRTEGVSRIVRRKCKGRTLGSLASDAIRTIAGCSPRRRRRRRLRRSRGVSPLGSVVRSLLLRIWDGGRAALSSGASAPTFWGNLVVRVGVCHHGVRREGLAGLWGSLRGRCASAACWRSGPDGSKWCARSKARMRGSDLVLALRPGWTHPGGAPSRAGRRLRAYAVAASRKGVSVRHMACRITASLRARATLAFRGPVRSAIARAQSRRRDAPSLRVMMALAAS